jgi:hypothetical protein
MEDHRLRMSENKVLRRTDLLLSKRDARNCIIKSFTTFILHAKVLGVSMQRG